MGMASMLKTKGRKAHVVKLCIKTYIAFKSEVLKKHR